MSDVWIDPPRFPDALVRAHEALLTLVWRSASVEGTRVPSLPCTATPEVGARSVPVDETGNARDDVALASELIRMPTAPGHRKVDEIGVLLNAVRVRDKTLKDDSAPRQRGA